MVGPLEKQLIQVVGKLIFAFGKRQLEAQKLKSMIESASRTVGVASQHSVLEELTAEELDRLRIYLTSPDLEQIALQLLVARLLDAQGFTSKSEELALAGRTQLRHGIMHSTGLREGTLFSITEAIFAELLTTTQVAWGENLPSAPSIMNLAIAGKVTAAAMRNGELLGSAADIHGYQRFERDLRAQVAALHAEMRLPHAGTSRTVPWDQLYVEPSLSVERQTHKRAHFSTLTPVASLNLRDEVEASQRIVILGDPGAGKSTLATKLAYDLATGGITSAHRTPFLLVLRDIAANLENGGQSVPEYMESLCRDPYNVTPPPNAVEYLLLNGRSLVIFDGLDELTETSLRTRIVRLIEGFVHMYPLVPVVVTSRRIGYSAAPLSEKLFKVAHLGEFSEEKVTKYASNWFNLDPSIPKNDRNQICAAFLKDSQIVEDLRANALMLSLLCGMYATERYIPRNRPEVYEKCAVMLFERWDRMRGINVSSHFGAQIRSAVQHLAWELFTKQRYGGALPRGKIVSELAGNHYSKRHSDENDAIEEAERFLDFCTGRAWILTDMGSNESELRYGFTHRTFLEYFAAEHLVRTRSSSPSKMFRTVRRHIERQEWEVVVQLALQMLDRNVLNGADKFLRLVLAAASSEEEKARNSLTSFAVRSLEYIQPLPTVVESLISLMLDDELSLDSPSRYPLSFDLLARPRYQTALMSLITEVSPENEGVVRRAMRAVFERKRHSEKLAATFCHLYHLALTTGVPTAVRGDLEEIYRSFGSSMEQIAETEAGIWFLRAIADERDGRVAEKVLRDGLTRTGMKLAYVMPTAGHGYFVSIAQLQLNSMDSRLSTKEVLEVIAEYLCDLNDFRPWFQRSHRFGADAAHMKESGQWSELPLGAVLAVLALPHLELEATRFLESAKEAALPDTATVTAGMLAARLGHAEFRPEEVFATCPDRLKNVLSYLDRWVAGEFSTFAEA